MTINAMASGARGVAPTVQPQPPGGGLDVPASGEAARPVPVAITTCSGPVPPTNVIETLPALLPGDDGAKLTMKLVVAPAAMLPEVLAPETTNSESSATTAINLTGAVAWLVTLTVCDGLVVPTSTVPKSSVDGIATIKEETPLAVNMTVAGGTVLSVAANVAVAA